MKDQFCYQVNGACYVYLIVPFLSVTLVDSNHINLDERGRQVASQADL